MPYDLTPAQRDAIREHLRRDAVLRPLVDGFEMPDAERVRLGRVYPALLRAVVGQQVSVQAAATIYRRFLALFDLEADGLSAAPAPAVLAAADAQTLRSAGLSGAKARYVVSLAEYFRDRPDAEEALGAMPDDEAVAELVTIKGVGRWTAEMMLMFALGRLDLLPLDDLAIGQSIVELYGLVADTPRALRAEQRAVAEPWRPYRSVACLYLYAWRRKQRYGGRGELA